MNGFYMYGIMREADGDQAHLVTMFPGRPLQMVVHDELRAVMTPTQEEKWDATPEALLGHFEVLSKLMTVGPVFPIRAGTVTHSEEEVRALLSSLRGMLGEVLEHLAGKAEYAVEARWNPTVAYPQIADADPQVRALKEQLKGQGTPPSLEQRLLVGKLVAEAVERQVGTTRHRIQTALRAVALDSAPLPRKAEPGVFMNTAFFVESTKAEAFESAIQTVGGSFREMVLLKYAGPLPPYSFTGCEIRVVTRASLEGASQLLGLSGTCTQKECRDRYRELSLRWHPDRHPGDLNAAERFKQLTAARELLEHFFAQRGSRFEPCGLPERLFLVTKTMGYQEHLEWV